MIIKWLFSICAILLLTWEMLEYRDNKKIADIVKHRNYPSPAFGPWVIISLLMMCAAPIALFFKCVGWMERNC